MYIGAHFTSAQVAGYNLDGGGNLTTNQTTGELTLIGSFYTGDNPRKLVIMSF